MKIYNNHAKICLPLIKRKDQNKGVIFNVMKKIVKNTSQDMAENTAGNLEKWKCLWWWTVSRWL